MAGVIGLGHTETPVIRLAICQDGRCGRTVPPEGEMFIKMIEKLEAVWKTIYSLDSTISVEWATFSFFDNTLPDLSTYNFFFMTGFYDAHLGATGGMPDRLVRLFRSAESWASSNALTAPSAPDDVKKLWQVRRRVVYSLQQDDVHRSLRWRNMRWISLWDIWPASLWPALV